MGTDLLIRMNVVNIKGEIPMLNYRRIKILSLLFAEEFTDPQVLAKETGLSSRTLFSEITEMNEIFAKNLYGLEILMHRGKGYYLEYPIEDTKEIMQLFRHATEYLDIWVNTYFGENNRVPWIIRHLLLSTTGVKIDNLCDLLNVSAATLNKDFQIIRKEIARYDLEIITRPYHGMTIVGSEMAIRQCLVDYCDVYSFFEDNIFDEVSKEQYQIGMDDVLITRLNLYKKCQLLNYQLTEYGFRRVANYLLIIAERQNTPTDLMPLFPLTPEIRLTEEFLLAQTILDEAATPTEITYLMVHLFINKEPAAVHYNSWMAGEFPAFAQQSLDIFQQAKTSINFDFTEHTDMTTKLKKIALQFLLRQKYNAHNFDVVANQYARIREAPASLSLALYLVQFLGLKQETYDFSRSSIFYELILVIYKDAYYHRNEYQKLRVAFIGEDPELFSLKMYNRMNLDKFAIETEVFHSYEMMYIDYEQFDYVFMPTNTYIDKMQFPVPIFEVDMRAGRNNNHFLWQSVFMERRKLNLTVEGFAKPEVITLETSVTTLVADIAAIFKPFCNFSEESLRHILHTQIFNLEMQLEQEILLSRSYVLFTTWQPEKMHYIINLKQPLTIAGKEIRILHFFILDLTYGPIMLKNGDSEISRLTT